MHKDIKEIHCETKNTFTYYFLYAQFEPRITLGEVPNCSQRYRNCFFCFFYFFQREMIMRSNFMRSKFNFFMRSNFWSWGRNSICSWGRICLIISIRRLTLRSWDRNSLIMLFFEFRSHDQFVSRKCDHEIECFYAQMANN